MLRRLKNLANRSQNADLYEYFYNLSRDVLGAVRFVSRDERMLIAYLRWLQVYRITHKLDIEGDPSRVLRDVDRYSLLLRANLRRWGLLFVMPIAALTLRLRVRAIALIKKPARVVRAVVRRLRVLARVALHRLFLLSTWPIRAPLRTGIRILRSKVRVRHLYLFSRKTAYDLLTRAGDLRGAIDAFERLRGIESHQDPAYQRQDELMRMLLPMVQNVEGGIRDIPAPAGEQGVAGLVVSVAVWGDRYLDLFENYCLPSLRAPGNLADLPDRRVYWHVFTNAAGRERLSRSEALAQMGSVRFETIPDELISLATGDNRYWLYGALTQTSFRYAARMQADVHFMNPDTVYARQFFHGVLGAAERENAEIVLSNSFRTTAETIRPELDAMRRGEGILDVPSGVLHSLSLHHLHPTFRPSFMSPDQMRAGLWPRISVVAWRDGDDLVMRTAHYTPMLVRRSMIRPDMRLSYFTVDSTILRHLARPDGEGPNVYILGPSDRAGYIEISERGAFQAEQVQRAKFTRLFWETNGRNEWELFGRELRLALDSAHDTGGIASSDAAGCLREFGRLRSELIGSRPLDSDTDNARRDATYTVIDLLSDTDTILGAEINHGCTPEIDTLVDQIRSAIRDRRTVYSDSELERAQLGRLCINLLRLGLLEELAVLRDRHALPLDGDGNAFIEFCRSKYPEFVERGAFYGAEHADRELFVVGSIVWGATYIDNFMDINVRSMLASGNLPALARGGRIVHAIVTNPSGAERIQGHPVYEELSAIVDIEFILVPDSLIQKLISDHLKGLFYQYYGMLDHCLVHYAKGMGAHLFMIPVDAVVANGSLSNMAGFRHQGYECCGGGNIVAETESFVAEIGRRYGDRGPLAISTYDLATLAIEHAHHYFRSQVIALENRDFGVHARELFWPSEGGVEIHSVFIHPLFTTASALARYTRMHFANIDYGMIPRMFNTAERIKVIDDASAAYINNFAAADRLYETAGRPFEPSIFVRAHDYSYPVQKALFPKAQFLPCRLQGWTPYRHAQADVSAIARSFGVLPLAPRGGEKESPPFADQLGDGVIDEMPPDPANEVSEPAAQGRP